MILDFLKIAIKNISKRKLRTFLTILGIVVAISAILSLLLLSNGLENSIESEFDKIGSNRIFLTSEGGLESNLAVSSLSEKDIKVVERTPGIDSVVKMLVSTEEVNYKNEKNIIQIRGLDYENWERLFVNDYGISLTDGRYLSNKDNYNVIIGWATSNTAFNKKINVGNSIEFLKNKFKVVGIFERVGADQDDKVIYVSMNLLRELINKPDKISFADIIVNPNSDVLKISEKIDRRLEKSRGKTDYSLITPDQLLEQTNNVLGIIKTVIIGIAIISLLVGSIGITNSMYTAVSERKYEIGIFKSLGAQKKDILKLFLIESSIIGLLGGIVGTILGISIAKLIEYIVSIYSPIGIIINLDVNLIIFSILFAMFFGILSGLSPAYSASKLKPVEALQK
ncbi:ABC transporter permease [Candidatus Woesearchaeota archaeon]|jgi:putative ABC transport system permease protein|nr:ABC transporter permease [Candidatus Woesearchaeota archaeon]MBT4387804.1 ABC transporter permease [Candidatus Woesearchaeota archaeon]MBT4595623.1 ABC transporter permease [Candidatus Woesearchaeota archaeon]MBT5740894.1 ABC transporter permease [Candidatus Woesearchaeota archaeon]MBT6505191.1 ABC transporter permease [Candidatus Woesearchaeota archaeon]